MGKKTWLPGKNLVKFISTTFGISQREQKEMVERISDAVSDAAPAVREKMNQLPGFRDIGKRMLATWSEGIQLLREPRVYAMSAWEASEVFQGISDPPKLECPSPVIGRSPLLANRPRRPRKAK
jgi:serine/threonine-protein kinase HipA